MEVTTKYDLMLKLDAMNRRLRQIQRQITYRIGQNALLFVHNTPGNIHNCIKMNQIVFSNSVVQQKNKKKN